MLTVPTAAISTANGKTGGPEAGQRQAVATEITVGESYGATTEVTEGPDAGDQVVITIANRIPTGTSSRNRYQGPGHRRRRFDNGGFPRRTGQAPGRQPQGNAHRAGRHPMIDDRFMAAGSGRPPLPPSRRSAVRRRRGPRRSSRWRTSSKTYATGAVEVQALRGRLADHRARRVRRHRRTLRVRQVDADEHPGLPGRRRRRVATGWTASTSRR